MFESNFPMDKASFCYHTWWNVAKRVAASCGPQDPPALGHGPLQHALTVFSLSFAHLPLPFVGVPTCACESLLPYCANQVVWSRAGLSAPEKASMFYGTAERVYCLDASAKL